MLLKKRRYWKYTRKMAYKRKQRERNAQRKSPNSSSNLAKVC